jgi:hypothetical protein
MGSQNQDDRQSCDWRPDHGPCPRHLTHDPARVGVAVKLLPQYWPYHDSAEPVRNPGSPRYEPGDDR